jgi:prophage DNA circulation protein
MSEQPEVVDEQAIERRGAIDVMQIPRLLGGALTDLRSIAEGIAVLPKLLVSLEVIQTRVESLDDEVKQMRTAVEGMGGDVSELQQGIERLEPHLEDVSRVAHPLKRIGNRTRRRPLEPGAGPLPPG